MSTNISPVFALSPIIERVQSITASYVSAGEAVTHSVATSSVEISNKASPKWSVEYQVDGGPWVAMGPGKTATLDVDLQATTVLVRRGEFAPASVDIRLTIQEAPGGLSSGEGLQTELLSPEVLVGIPSLVPEAGNWRQLLSRAPGTAAVARVMASPPTTAFTTTNPLASGQAWLCTDSNAAYGAPYPFSAHRAGGHVLAQFQYIESKCIDYGSGIFTNTPAYSVEHVGSRIDFIVRGGGANLFVKVNDEYVSLTPFTNPPDGNLYYLDLDFGSVAERRIEVVGSQFLFGGCWVGATDAIRPATIRGPLAIVAGDSITEGTGWVAAGSAVGYVQAAAEYLGWDDLRPSGVGATGYLQAPNPKKKIRDRLASDVFAYNPQLVIFAGGINDGSFTYAEVLAEVLACIDATAAALPAAEIVVMSPLRNAGVAYAASTQLDTYKAVRDACAARSSRVFYLDLWRLPLPAGTPTHTITTSFVVGLGATTAVFVQKPIIGATYAWSDDSAFTVKSVSGGGPFSATIDYNPTAAAAGAVATRVGSCYLQGNGKVGATTGWGNADTDRSNDGTHPSGPFAGHKRLGIVVGAQLQRLLAT